MPKDDCPPAFLLYVDDFASDGKVEAMTTQQVGAYILLLCKAWREDPPGSIPTDDRVLARWARLTPDEWSECRAGVLAAFTLGTDDRWHQKRMRKEFAKLIEKAKEKSKAAKRAAAARWNHNECGPHYERNADALPKNANTTSSSSSRKMRASDVDVGTTTADVDALRIEIPEEEIPAIIEQCRRVTDVIPLSSKPKQNEKDKSLIFKAVVLSRTRMSEQWLADSIEAVRQHPEVANKAGYLHGVLRSKCKVAGLNFNHLLTTIDVPDEILKPRVNGHD